MSFTEYIMIDVLHCFFEIRDKIDGIIRQGGGIVDEHAPQNPDLVAFWVRTSSVKRNKGSTEMQAELKATAKVDDHFLSLVSESSQIPIAGSGATTSLTMDQILAASAAARTTLPCLSGMRLSVFIHTYLIVESKLQLLIYGFF
jgi:hypothetical protein